MKQSVHLSVNMWQDNCGGYYLTFYSYNYNFCIYFFYVPLGVDYFGNLKSQNDTNIFHLDLKYNLA